MRTYFYKLHNLLYLALLPPLLLFGYLYLEHQQDAASHTALTRTVVLFMALYTMFILGSFYYTKKAIASIPQDALLEIKLARYASTIRLRFFAIGVASLLLVGGFYFLHHQLFLVLFGITLVLYSFFWPTPRKVCNDLRLKGTEREAVMERKDNPA